MPVPFPDESTVDREPPTNAEVVELATGILSAARPAGGNTAFQQLLVEAVFESMTGHVVSPAELAVVDMRTAAARMARREEAFRREGPGYVVGVQWHPEFHDWKDTSLLSGDPLLAEFLDAVGAARRDLASAC